MTNAYNISWAIDEIEAGSQQEAITKGRAMLKRALEGGGSGIDEKIDLVPKPEPTSDAAIAAAIAMHVAEWHSGGGK